jgi:hypothetical protein
MTPEQEQLHHAVIRKIEEEWQVKWQASQGNFSHEFNIANKNAFYISMKEQVPDADINIHSIRRFLQKDEKKRGFQVKTLDFFSRYLGFQNWNDYIKPIEYTKPIKKNKNWVLPICILTLIGLLYFLHWKNEQDRIFRTLNKVIIEANQVQLKCYQRLPVYDTTGLDKYYILNKAAYNDIKKVLIRNSIARHWFIKTPPSGYEYFDMKINSLTDSTARVTVKEFWHLQYFNAKIPQKEELTYKSLRPCSCYFLKKNGENWKIENCLFEHYLVQNIGGKLKTQAVNVGVCPCE